MKQKRYWLRTGLTLAIILFVYSLFIDWLSQAGVSISAGLFRILYDIGYPFIFVRFLSTGFQDSIGASILGDIIASAVFFLVGSLIGWIYGRMRRGTTMK